MQSLTTLIDRGVMTGHHGFHTIPACPRNAISHSSEPIIVSRDDSGGSLKSYTFAWSVLGRSLTGIGWKGVREGGRGLGRGGLCERVTTQEYGSPLALAGVLAIITEVDGSGATSWQHSIIGSQNGAPQNLQVFLVAGHAHPHMVWQPHL